MKTLFKRGLIIGALSILVFTLSGCKKLLPKTPIDYGDAESFEAALNEGKNLEGKVVQFRADELHPDSAFGYNVWAGEHLNFISSRNPDIEVGDIVVVKTDAITSSMKSWFITYEKVDNAKVTDETIFSDGTRDTEKNDEDDVSKADEVISDNADAVRDKDSSDKSATFLKNDKKSTSDEKTAEKEEVLPIKLVDCGWYMNESSGYGDTAYVNYCVILNNPNKNLIAQFPRVCITVRNGDGSILATQDYVGGMIMPEDTITLCAMFSMPIADLTDDAQISFEASCDDMVSRALSVYEEVRTSDLEITNISEHGGQRDHYITGEVTNNSSIDVDMANVSLVLRKDGEIVFMECTFIDNLKTGSTKAFQFQRYHDWPEHDTIECSAQSW